MLRYAALIAMFVLAFTDPALPSYWIVRGSDKNASSSIWSPLINFTKVGKDVYVSCEKAEADVKKFCKD